MSPFEVDPFWYQDYWYRERAIRQCARPVWNLRRSAVMAAAAVLRPVLHCCRRIAGVRDQSERQTP